MLNNGEEALGTCTLLELSWTHDTTRLTVPQRFKVLLSVAVALTSQPLIGSYTG